MIEELKGHPVKMALMLASMLSAIVMQTLDTTIANVALPHMQGAMSASQDQISWVVTSYVVASAIGISLTSFVTARFGRTKVFALSVVGFTLASMLCGTAQSLTELVAFRMLQGFSGASLIPLSQTILMDVFPREKFGQAMAIWGMGVLLGPIFGPTIGGYITETYSWRWVFYINVPIGILCALGVALLLPETRRDPKHYFDFRGFMFLGIALVAFQLMLDRGESQGWFGSPEIMTEAIIAGASFYLFLAHVFTTAQPFLSPGLFKDINFSAGISVSVIITLTMFSLMTLLPLMMQNLLGFSATDTGLLMMPRGIGMMIAMGLSGRLLAVLEARVLILVGIAITSVALWQMSGFTLYTPSRDFIITGVLQGLGLGLLFPPLNAVAFITLEARVRTQAASVFNLVRNIASSIGISGVITLIAQNSQINHAELVEHVTPFSRALQELAGTGMWDMGSAGGAAALNNEVSRQAAMIAYVDVFRLMTYGTLLIAPVLLLFRNPKKKAAAAPPPEHAVAEI